MIAPRRHGARPREAVSRRSCSSWTSSRAARPGREPVPSTRGGCAARPTQGTAGRRNQRPSSTPRASRSCRSPTADRLPGPPLESRPPAHLLRPEAEVYRALTLGTADYIRKNGFSRRRARPVRGHRLGAGAHRRGRRDRPAGRDRRLAAFALHRGDEPRGRVDPGRPSRRAADRAADRGTLPPRTARCWRRRSRPRPPDVTEENLQARIRGKHRHGRCPTSSAGWCSRPANKSEMSVGYATPLR